MLKHQIIANAPPISRENLSDPLRVLAPEHLRPHPASLAHCRWPHGHPRPLGCCRAATPCLGGGRPATPRAARPPPATKVWPCSYPRSMGRPCGHPRGLGVAFEPTLDGSRVGPMATPGVAAPLLSGLSLTISPGQLRHRRLAHWWRLRLCSCGVLGWGGGDGQ